MLARSIMKVDPIVVGPDQTAVEVSYLFSRHGIDDAPVLDAEERLVGIISKTRLLEVLHRQLPPDTPVRELMNTSFRVLLPDDNLNDFWDYEEESLPVVADGKLVGYINCAEAAIILGRMWAASNQDLQAIANSMHNALVSIDDRGNIRNFNRALEKMVGLSSEQIRGRNIMEIFKNSKLLNVLKTGEPQSTQKVVVGDKTLLSNRTPIIKHGQVVGAVAVLQDISELEAISQELEYTKRLANELDAIIESSFDGLYVTDGKGVTIRVNQGFCRITGVPAEECLGRNMAELVETGVYSRSGSLLALERKERVTIPLQARTGKWVLVTSTPIFDENGEIPLVVTNVRDITELNDLHHKLQQAEELRRLYQSELQQLKMESTRQIITRSPKMRELINLVLRLAGVDSTVLLQGESGVGKELIADIIYSNSTRRKGPFIKVNCAAIPENLLETELFGYESGAFTGASKNGKIGLFELASGGTIFLDEIAELPVNLQVKLLRVLQERQIIRVGGTTSIKVDLRVLAATNRNLEEMVKSKQFREDLFYRLNVVPVYVPPLRERQEDIPILIQHFLSMFNRKYHMRKWVSQEVIDCLIRYEWPGNIRELENLIERLVVTAFDDMIGVNQLPAFLYNQPPGSGLEIDLLPLRDAVENLERQLLHKAFARFDSTYKVAHALKVNQSTIVRKAAKYGIRPFPAQ